MSHLTYIGFFFFVFFSLFCFGTKCKTFCPKWFKLPNKVLKKMLTWNFHTKIEKLTSGSARIGTTHLTKEIVTARLWCRTHYQPNSLSLYQWYTDWPRPIHWPLFVLYLYFPPQYKKRPIYWSTYWPTLYIEIVGITWGGHELLRAVYSLFSSQNHKIGGSSLLL